MISESSRFPYWCHRCQRETFPVSNLSGEPSCNFCRQTYIEELTSYQQDNPQISRQPTRANTDVAQTHSRRAQSQTGRAPSRVSYRLMQNDGRGNVIQYTFMNPVGEADNLRLNPIMNMFFSQYNPFANFLQQHNGDQQFESLLNYIMQNDPNMYGTPPASEKSIKALKREKVLEENKEQYEKQECSVCKDNFKLGDQLSNMPCKHNFHEDCLMPWLKQHNSCPVCRYELPTEDQDYEKRKEELRRTMTNGVRETSHTRSNSNDGTIGTRHTRRTSAHFHPEINQNARNNPRHNQNGNRNINSDPNNPSHDVKMDNSYPY